MADKIQGQNIWSRRNFLMRTTGASAGLLFGMAIPFARNMPASFVPLALAQDSDAIDGKAGLTQLNDRPLNAETPPHLLDDSVTPTNRHFIRNNGNPPDEVDPSTWQLTIDGLVDKVLSLSIADLKSQFEVISYDLLVECGGNGRAFFDPPASGNQWTYGAVACSNWTGVRLRDVLNAAGVKPEVIYTAHEGTDSHLSGNADLHPVSRGMPIEKAMDPYNLIAFAQNGQDLHPMNGAPLRLVIPGWPGSCSQKWLSRIYLRDQVHDGAKMTGTSYRVPGYQVAPGEKVATEDFQIIEAMPVKSLITYPQTMADISNETFEIRGHAWSGDTSISTVDISYDFGATWQKADLNAPSNTNAWQRWTANINLPEKGYYEIWARAIDANGQSQPFAIDWNPKGYLNNTLHRIAVRRT
ncbi:MAG: sulfite oxidase [Kordiimonadaceae bacterium]|jgi:DMSO/TMAO reductase YedYZ molybdopterin-dependent catalytic subunit|nr:sulfite oxidase [Kordiimonadaceae bacterium]MBT6036019.1 sulfite oxidase [Kordiimonadaceae bacterium]MBT6329867.1 sulfite oxidase [Kordiimonadaceae bacterium]MBT7583192.1 sulfite oxidase [Kordiimonadaceae bacterium]